jgi:hypothetical protein
MLTGAPERAPNVIVFAVVNPSRAMQMLYRPPTKGPCRKKTYLRRNSLTSTMSTRLLQLRRLSRPGQIPFRNRTAGEAGVLTPTCDRLFVTTATSPPSSIHEPSSLSRRLSRRSPLYHSFATASAPKTDGPSLKETLERLKTEPKKNEGEEDKNTADASSSSSGSGTATGASNFDFQTIMSRAADAWDVVKSEVQTGWQEIVASSERKSINKKLRPTETADGDAPYTGPLAIMIIDPSEKLTAWERMQKRLTEAPIIQSIIEKSDELYQKSGADKVKRRIDDLREDAQEAWETSQNPWVYRLSSVYETVTADSPETLAVAELRKLDPDFTLEDWRRDVVQYNLPKIMQWFLEGRINQLKPWLGEGVFKRMAAEMKAREQEGTQIDTHVLGIMNSEILAVEVSLPPPTHHHPFDRFDAPYHNRCMQCTQCAH